MIRRSALTLCLFYALISSCSCSSDKAKSAKESEKSKPVAVDLSYDPKTANKTIDAFMQKLHKTRQFNGNVLVADKGKIIYQNTFGWADYLHRDSLKVNSRFELASVTKPMTATAVLMLAEEGKLKLDQTINDFFPNFPYKGITIRMLLSHRSGLMNYVYFVDRIWKSQHKDERKGITNADVMALIEQYKPSVYTKPDFVFHYNNSNFMILGAIIEKVSGMKFSQFMMERIFKPCGMKNTAVYSKAEYSKIPVDVVGHDRTWRYSVVQNFLDGPVGDKGIYSTVQDLLVFDRCMRANKVLSKAWQDSAYAAHNPMVRGHFNYGYGWRTFEGGGHKIVYHTGWWHGFRHIYLRDLTTDKTIVLLGNLTNGSLLQLDELYKAMGMPVVRKGLYNGSGDSSDD